MINFEYKSQGYQEQRINENEARNQFKVLREIGEIACPNVGLALELWRSKKISIYTLDISRTVPDYDRQYA